MLCLYNFCYMPIQMTVWWFIKLLTQLFRFQCQLFEYSCKYASISSTSRIRPFTHLFLYLENYCSQSTDKSFFVSIVSLDHLFVKELWKSQVKCIFLAFLFACVPLASIKYMLCVWYSLAPHSQRKQWWSQMSTSWHSWLQPLCLVSVLHKKPTILRHCLMKHVATYSPALLFLNLHSTIAHLPRTWHWCFCLVSTHLVRTSL